MEAIHVELANERGVVVVLEQFGYQFMCELVLVKNDEGVASVRPSDKVGVVAII